MPPIATNGLRVSILAARTPSSNGTVPPLKIDTNQNTWIELNTQVATLGAVGAFEVYKRAVRSFPKYLDAPAEIREAGFFEVLRY